MTALLSYVRWNTSLPKLPTLPDIKNLAHETASSLSASARFAYQFFQHPTTLGTPFTCSSFVAEELLRFVNPENSKTTHPRRFLEVGAGTGAMTDYLIKKLNPEDTLDVVEINPELCKILRKRYNHLDHVSIHETAIQNWTPKEPRSIKSKRTKPRKFDVIISTVPLNSLPSKEVLDNIFNTYKRLIKPNGIFSSAGYAGTATLGKICYFGKKRKKFGSMMKSKEIFFNRYGFRRRIVAFNLPPALVIHCKLKPSSSASFRRLRSK